MNSVYLKHSLQNFDPTPYKTWYESAKLKIVKNFGQAFDSLLRFFIHNYPQDNLCYIRQGTDNGIAMLINYIALISISYAKVPNYFSRQFFTCTGQLLPNLSAFSQNHYYIGAETSDIQSYLKMLSDNFDKMKSTSFNSSAVNSGFNICSNTCDHLYIIVNCGRPNMEVNCYFCGNKIGGTNNVLVPRPGHRNVSENEAKAFLNQKLTAYRSSEPTGFPYFSRNYPQTLHRNLTNICTPPLLNFFTNSAFYFLYSANLYPAQQFDAVYRIAQLNFKTVVESILNENFRSFKDLGESDLIFKLLGAINKLKEVMSEFPGDPSVKNDRDEFEQRFEQKILAQSFADLATQYKRCLETQTQPSVLIKYIEETEKPKEPMYKHSELFRYRSKPTWDSFKEAFKLIQKKDEFLVLSELIENCEDLQNLKLLWPIAKFSNEMIKKCSFAYSRAKAQKETIGDFLAKNQELRPSFIKFSNAWRNLKMVLNFDCKTFNKVNLSKQSSLAYLLAETKLDSLGIQLASALRMLCEIQNKFCSFLPQNKSTNFKVDSLSNLSNEDIIVISPQVLESMVQKCSSNCLEFGKGQEVSYNFQQFINEVYRYLRNAKFINIEKIEVVNYKFEIFSPRSAYAGAIMSIRQNDNQESLSLNEVLMIKDKVKLKSDWFKVNSLKIWSQAYTWLGLVCLHT